MTRIGKAYGYTVKNVIIHTVFAPQKLRTAFLSVLYGVERNISRFARAFCPSVAPLCFKLLYVRRILKHNSAELRCGRGCVNRPFVSVCRKVRQLAGMVYVSMGQKMQSISAGDTGISRFLYVSGPCSIPQSIKMFLPQAVRSVQLPVTSCAAPKNIRFIFSAPF